MMINWIKKLFKRDPACIEYPRIKCKMPPGNGNLSCADLSKCWEKARRERLKDEKEFYGPRN